ncbi:MAG: C39 family peptidase [Chloroflexota bacterium]
MSTKTKRIIVVVVIVQLILAVAFFALPRAVQALPGRYLVRLQNHPLTSGVIERVTTPYPEALPVAQSSGTRAVVAADQIPDIPGLEDVSQEQPSPTPTPLPTETTIAESTPTPEATAEPPTPTPTMTPSPTPTPLPERVMLEDLIVVRQGFNNCGPANMTIALNYFGDNTTQEAAASYLKPNEEDRNVSPWQISDYVNEFTNLRSTVHSGGDMEMVKEFIAAGFPVVIEKGYEPSNGAGWYGHYLTVYGYDEAAGEFYSRDTNLGPFDGSPRADSYEEFNRWWQQFNYTFYVIFPPDDEQLVMSIIPDQLEDPADMWQFTAERAREEIAENPEDVFTHFNLGVSLTRLGELTGQGDYYDEASDVFDNAREIGLPPRTLFYEHRPLMAYWKAGRLEDVFDLTDAVLATTGGRWVEEIFWYRGNALATQGDLSAAREAYAEALEVNSNFWPAQQSIDWVDSVTSG